VLCHVFIALYAIGHEGRGPGSFLGDENDVALALIVALPYAWFLAQCPGMSIAKRVLYLTSAAIIVLGAVSTTSRGGFLGLVVVALGMLILSPNKIRNLVLGVLFGGLVLTQIPQKYWDEMHTISVERPDESSNERLYSWRRSWEMFLDNPIIGVGAGNWGWRVQAYELTSGEFNIEKMRPLRGRVAHSLYFTLLPETGIVGTAIYLGMVWMIARRLQRFRSLRNDHSDDPDWKTLVLLSRAMMVSLFGFLAAGAFISVLYYPQFWTLIGLVVALERAGALILAPHEARGCKNTGTKVRIREF
jgi:probable O-glycosylation ligase (exosortase A-associated)